MKIGQLIEYNMRNISVVKLYTKCFRETIPRPFSPTLYRFLLLHANLRPIKF